MQSDESAAFTAWKETTGKRDEQCASFEKRIESTDQQIRKFEQDLARQERREHFIRKRAAPKFGNSIDNQPQVTLQLPHAIHATHQEQDDNYNDELVTVEDVTIDYDYQQPLEERLPLSQISPRLEEMRNMMHAMRKRRRLMDESLSRMQHLRFQSYREERRFQDIVHMSVDSDEVTRTKNKRVGSYVWMWIFVHVDAYTRFRVLPLVCKDFSGWVYKECESLDVYIGQASSMRHARRVNPNGIPRGMLKHFGYYATSEQVQKLLSQEKREKLQLTEQALQTYVNPYDLLLRNVQRVMTNSQRTIKRLSIRHHVDHMYGLAGKRSTSNVLSANLCKMRVCDFRLYRLFAQFSFPMEPYMMRPALDGVQTLVLDIPHNAFQGTLVDVEHSNPLLSFLCSLPQQIQRLELRAFDCSNLRDRRNENELSIQHDSIRTQSIYEGLRDAANYQKAQWKTLYEAQSQTYKPVSYNAHIKELHLRSAMLLLIPLCAFPNVEYLVLDHCETNQLPIRINSQVTDGLAYFHRLFKQVQLNELIEIRIPSSRNDNDDRHERLTHEEFQRQVDETVDYYHRSIPTVPLDSLTVGFTKLRTLRLVRHERPKRVVPRNTCWCEHWMSAPSFRFLMLPTLERIEYVCCNSMHGITANYRTLLKQFGFRKAVLRSDLLRARGYDYDDLWTRNYDEMFAQFDLLCQLTCAKTVEDEELLDDDIRRHLYEWCYQPTKIKKMFSARVFNFYTERFGNDDSEYEVLACAQHAVMAATFGRVIKQRQKYEVQMDDKTRFFFRHVFMNR